MKVKTFILSLLLTMFCSTSFGQHWGEIPNHYEGNMTFVTQIFIDGELQGEDIEIGAFCGDEFRGCARPIASQANLVFLLIEGDGDHNGDQISFRLAKHNADGTSVELGNVIFNALTYVHNATIGGYPADLVNGLLPEDDRTEFNSVARLNGKVYPSLANALAACTTGSNTIELLKNNAEDVTIKQVEGVSVTIDGGTSRYDYSGTITIHGNARYQGAETLTFTNIDFTTDKAGHYFIDSNSTGSVERYAHNVTVINCNFTATGAGENSAAAMRIRQGYNIAINGGKFNGLHSVLQAYGNAGINITGIESNCKNGISVGSSTNVVITDSDITATGATGYGVRAGENVTGPITITGTEINAFIPVSVRKVTDDTNCEFTFTGNTMTASNTDGYWCVIGTSEYEANGSLPETAGKIIVNATEQDLAGVYGYSRVEVTFADSTTKYFYMMEDAVPYNNADNYEGATIKLLSNCAGRGLRFWENGMTFDLNGKKYTINQAVGSSGTESQGFQIRPEVTGNVTITNGTIDIEAGTNVKWMFNSYAADFVVKDVTIDGTNMVTNTSEDYLLVVQNAGDKATFENVTIQNYDAKKVYLEGNTTFVAPQEFDNIEIPAGYVLVYENGAYIVKAGNVLNVNTGEKYDKISSAITAATAGDTLQLLQDITEDVTVNKDLTINGDNKQYTGNISVETSSTDITVKNVNFVNGTGYAITTNRIKSVTVENCTVNNYGYGFLYANKSTPTVVVKNVTVEGGNYGFHWVYGTTATLENVTMTNVANGLYIQNYAGKTINVKNSTISSIAIWERSGSSGVQTFKFEGDNTVTTLTDSQYAKYVLAATDATLTAPEGANVTTSVENHIVKYEDGKYIVVGAKVQVKDGDEVKGTFATLAEAITAAQAGNTIVLLNNITENVTVNKNVTIDGGDKNYTGTMTISNGKTVTVQNVNFVKGCIDKAKGTSGTLTVKNCDFDGVDESINYAVTMRGGSTVTIEGGDVKNYGYGMLYVPSAVSNVNVKEMTVNDVNYGVHVAYGSKVNIDSVTMTNVAYGIMTQNYGAKTITIKNSNISGTNPIYVWERNTTVVDTFKFEGANTFSGLPTSDQAKLVLGNENALTSTLTAPEGYNVTSGVDNLEVIYKNGCYSLYGLSGSGAEEDPFLIYNLEDLKFFRDHVNAGKTRYNAENVYVALADDIDMLSEDWSVNIGDDCNSTFDGIFDGQGHTLYNLNSTETAQKADVYVCTGLFGAIRGNAVVKNLTIENVNINTGEFTGNNVAAVVGFVYGVSGKTVTIDGVKVTGDINIDASGVYGVGAIVGYSYNQGTLNIKNCAVEANDESAITAVSGSGAIIGYCGGKATIEDCSVQNIDITAKGLVGGIAGITENSVNKVLSGNTVKDVTLIATKTEWVNSTAIAVGTMDGNGLTVANTIFENVNASRMVGSVYAVQPTYVVPAVEARIENKYYGTFDAALAAAQEGNTITVLAPVVITEDKTYDLTGLSVVGENVYPIFRIQNGAEVTVKGEGTITNDDYVFVVGASDSSSAGNLTIENGTYIGETTVAQVTLGNLTIKGGRFSITDVEPYDYAYLINCKDANYTNGTADVEIYGGTFVGFDPENNAAEGAGTNFCADGYLSDDNGDGTYTVREGVYVAQVGDKKFESFDEAFAYAKSTTDNDAITILKTIVLSANQTIDFENIAVTSTVNPAFRITDGATVTVENGNMNTENGGYNFILGASDGSSAGNLTIKSGKYHASTTVASVTKGNLVIEGGEFSATPYNGDCRFLINCIDANYTNGSAKVEIKGGTFVGFDPENNLAEGAGTNFCAEGYLSDDNSDGTYTVRQGVYVAQVNDGAKYESLVEAVAAAEDNDVVKLIADATGAGLVINKDITVDFGGFTYTINQAVGSTGTETQGFQLLPSAENVTLKNGNIAVTAGTNVIWMINDYAKNLTVEDMTFDCSGMNLGHSAVMGLVINNLNNTDPKVVFGANVIFNGLTTSILLEHDTQLTAGEGWMNAIEPEDGYVVVYKEGVYTVARPVASITREGVTTEYATLGDATKAAVNGDVVKLLCDVNGSEVTVDLQVAKKITVDLGGHKYTSTGTAFIAYRAGTELTLTNGTVHGNGAAGATLRTTYKATLTLGDNLTVTAGPQALAILVQDGKFFVNPNTDNVIVNGGIDCIKVQENALEVSIASGTYTEDVQEWCADGYVSQNNGDGTWTVREADYVAEIEGGAKYESLQAAIDAAQDGQTVTLLKDINYTFEDTKTTPEGQPILVDVTGKYITLDFAGKKISVNHQSTTDRIYAVVFVADGAGLTVTGNGFIDVDVNDNTPKVAYMFWKRGTTGHLTIENGNFHMDNSEDSMVYTNGDEIVTVNGGTFTLDMVGTRANGFPCIFNATGQNAQKIIVNGGTFNADVNHQFWANEVYVPETLALQNNGDETWTVVDAVAYVTEIATSTGATNRQVGYATLAEAVNPLGNSVDNTVTVIKAHKITSTAVVERDNMTIDFASLAITGNVYPVVRIQNDANVTVKNGNITNNDYVFVLGASDGSSAGNLTIESGVYTGTTTVASVTKGLLTINGGEFKVNDSEYGATYMINCIDANYNDDSANVEIYGGKFYGFNPENNAAEGANTNFCAQGYGAVENPTDVWTVVPKQTAEVKDGWNWFSYYVEGDVLDQLQNSLGAAGVQIKSRTAFTQYSNGNWNGDLLSTTPAESYKINVNADAVINVTGNIVNPSECPIMLNNGGTGNGAWNWIGYPLAQETSVETAFTGVVKNGDQVKTRTGFAEYVNDQWWGLLMTLEPGVGYMYFRAGANETVSNFTYPTPSSKEAVQPNITADANLWVPNSTSYANNMTMVAVLNMNGEMMNDNYEVAAMVNGEVRGSARPIYVEPMDAYMLFLTIHGEGVEEVTFQCYDFNTDTEYVLNNTINYSDDARLGSVNEPYVLCYGTMGIGENAMNTINIYPNPTTTDREINLQATCDKVEVFNALGVKVAEYHNVDTLDAIETAGIYVIRVTNDGDVKHCRLVVK